MRIKLRLEPYDPDARDADGDGIVQEGTAWERPAGAKVLDDLGNEIKRGLTSPYRNTTWKLVDRDGNNLDYRPSYGTDADFNPKESKPTLEKLGYRSIEQMGLPTVKDLVLPSTKPQEPAQEQEQVAPPSPFDILDNVGPTSSVEGRLWNVIEYTDDQTFTRDGFYYLLNNQLDEFLAMTVELYGPELGLDEGEEITLNDALAVFRDRRDSARSRYESMQEIRLWRSGGVRNTAELVSFTSDRSEAEEFGDEPLEYIVPVGAIYSTGHASYDGELLIDQSMVRLASEQDSETNDSMQSNLSSLFDELREEGDGWMAGGPQVAELINDFENGELPEEFDDNALSEEIFRIEEEAREARFQRLESTVSVEGAETLRSWIDGRYGATYSIREEIEDRFLKPEDRAAELADLASIDRNSDEWKREYESQLTRIKRVQSFSSGADSLLEMIDNSPIQQQPLYRGMMLSPEQLDTLVAQGRINFPIGATSSTRSSALEYAGRGENQSVLFEIEGAHAFPAHLFSRVDENEFLISGEFEIVSVSQEDSRYGSFPVVKIRPTGRTYREHGRELLSGRESSVIESDGPDLHVQEIQAKQSADEASRIIAQLQARLSPHQEEAISVISDLLFGIRNPSKWDPNNTVSYQGNFDEDSLIPGYEVAFAVAKILPEEITANTGETFMVAPNWVDINDSYILVGGSIQDENGTWVGDFTRRLRVDASGDIVINHYTLNVYTEHQNKGIGSSFNAEMQKTYSRLGASRIEVDAVSRVDYEGDEDTPPDMLKGASFWARQGYDWQDEASRQTILRGLERIVPKGATVDLEPDPETTFVKGLSAGFLPAGPEKFDIAYFDSIEEWRTFVDSVVKSRNTSFEDPGRPVAGDLMRWSGADMWVARQELSTTYVKNLEQPIDVEGASLSALGRTEELNSEKRKSAALIGAVFNLDSLSDFDFGLVDRRLFQDIDDGFTIEDSELFGLQILKLFEGSFTTRDGSSYVIQPNDVYSNIGEDASFYINGVILDESGSAGRFTRTLRITTLPDGTKKIVAEHDNLEIPKNYQGRGIASAFNAELEKIYTELGVDRIELVGLSDGAPDSSNQYIGATHWARNGYDWATDFSRDEFVRTLENLIDFDDDADEYVPSDATFVEGLSTGTAPSGRERMTKAYFSSIEEWENFVEMMNFARAGSLDDETRVVAGDLVRWDGADDWFAGRQLSFDYVKKLKED